MINRTYLERGIPVQILARWSGRGPRNVLIRRASGEVVVRPFRGLRRDKAVAEEAAKPTKGDASSAPSP